MPWSQYFDGKFWQSDISTKYTITGIPAMFLLDQEARSFRPMREAPSSRPR